MTMRAAEYEAELEAELEFENELEAEFENELESEFENEFEGEEFLGGLRNLAGRAWDWTTQPGSPQRAVALRAARWGLQRGGQALGGAAGRSGGGALGSRLGGAVGGLVGPEGIPIGQALGRWGGQRLGGWAGRRLGGWAGDQIGTRVLPQQEYESEFEVNPIRRIYPDALMEHLGHAATTARSEAEAEAFIGALIPLAVRLVPRAAAPIFNAAPGLVSGLSGVAQVLRRNPQTRGLVRTLPTIMRRTAATVARQVASGSPVTPQSAVRTMARQTAQVLGQPATCSNSLMRSRALDRQYHRAMQANNPQRMFEF